MKRTRTSIALFIALALLLGACAFPGLSGPAQNSGDTVGTAAALTAQAMMTERVLKTVNAYMTASPTAPGVALAQATATLAPSSTPITLTPTRTRLPPTNTPLPPTATPEPCNAAKFTGDLTIPDGEILNAGRAFTKTWRLMNVGSCIWTTDFTLVFVSGDPMGVGEPVNLPKIVLPGESVFVSVNLTAPQEPGGFIGYYQLKSDTGVQFGIGPNATKSFWVRINVVQKGTAPGEIYALYKNTCKAAWITGNVVPLACESVATKNGGVFNLAKPTLEGNRAEDDPAIITVPSDGKDGYIQGVFPPVSIKEGNHFKTVIGCLANSDACSVTFKLQYIADGGPVEEFGSWPQVTDGKLRTVDIDLRSLAGKSVQFILKVTNNGDPTEDRAFWLMPRVTRYAN